MKRLSVLILMVLITTSCGMLVKQPIYGVKTDTIYKDVKLTDTLIYMDTEFIDTTICPAGLVRDSVFIDTILIKGRTEYKTRIVKVPIVLRDTTYLNKNIIKYIKPDGSMDWHSLLISLFFILASVAVYFNEKRKNRTHN
jgi:hypothetical protein